MQWRLYHILIDVKPIDATTLDPATVNGAAVRCLVPGTSPDDAMTSLAEQLTRDGLELTETDWCVDFDEFEWENPDDPDEQELAEKARKTGRVQYGTFHTWGHDAPDAD